MNMNFMKCYNTLYAKTKNVLQQYVKNKRTSFDITQSWFFYF
ncbi:hypothetical protein lbkm_3230 [Lachnospiraceae bacterium KM106-2]|nr:hypothetical protein lbkm_3230 [Lachnospiraceae bacterium KM106-2]